MGILGPVKEWMHNTNASHRTKPILLHKSTNKPLSTIIKIMHVKYLGGGGGGGGGLHKYYYYCSFLSEAGLTAGSAAVAAELRKHSGNGAIESVLSWCGHAFPLWWSHMELRTKKLLKLFLVLHLTMPQGPTPPSPRWSPTCMAA